MRIALASCFIVLLSGCSLYPPGAAGVSGGTPPSQPSSFVLGSPVGITTNVHEGILVKDGGFQPGPPAGGSMPLPDFAGLPGQLFGGIHVPQPVLAMSLGLDVITVQPTEWQGQLAWALLMGSHGWIGLEFSVNEQEIADTSNLAPDVAALLGTSEIDRSVFSYLVPGSDAVLLPTEGETVRCLEPSHLGLADPGDEIHALNMHMALYYTDLGLYPDAFTTRKLPEDVRVFFTLTPELVKDKAAVDHINQHWQLQGAQPDTGTIYVTKWATGSWTPPTVFQTGVQLFAPSSPPPDLIIDGLAIDAHPSNTVPDGIMFSMRSTQANDVPARDQLLYKISGGKSPGRVVVPIKPGSSEYGALGAQIRCGRGCGDFCVKDPILPPANDAASVRRRAALGSAAAALMGPLLIDDFFIARRLPPGRTYLLQQIVGANLLGVPGQPFPIGSPLIAYRSGRRTVVPEMRLAVSGFRQLRDGRSYMLSCMSWPQPLAEEGSATVQWGTMKDLTIDPAQPGAVVWEREVPLHYAGKPLTARHDLLKDGLLPPRTEPNQPPLGSNKLAALVVRWKLWADGRLYISPIAALRQ